MARRGLRLRRGLDFWLGARVAVRLPSRYPLSSARVRVGPGVMARVTKRAGAGARARVRARGRPPPAREARHHSEDRDDERDDRPLDEALADERDPREERCLLRDGGGRGGWREEFAAPGGSRARKTLDLGRLGKQLLPGRHLSASGPSAEHAFGCAGGRSRGRQASVHALLAHWYNRFCPTDPSYQGSVQASTTFQEGGRGYIWSGQNHCLVWLNT